MPDRLPTVHILHAGPDGELYAKRAQEVDDRIAWEN